MACSKSAFLLLFDRRQRGLLQCFMWARWVSHAQREKKSKEESPSRSTAWWHGKKSGILQLASEHHRWGWRFSTGNNVQRCRQFQSRCPGFTSTACTTGLSVVVEVLLPEGVVVQCLGWYFQWHSCRAPRRRRSIYLWYTINLVQRNVLPADGAPPHACITVREWPNALFLQKWIRYGDNISWPLRRSDLNPVDSYISCL